ncbi:MAG: ATP-dependent DNA helicase RecG [Pseudomonadota bacterium]|nr:ATP-dependent DNA helicase RecG [Pseudomonadota bacterium]
MATRNRLEKLGIRRDFDLVLHLPLRYEDETHLYPISDLPFDRIAQTEGELLHAEIQYRPRRQLVCQIADGTAVLYLRFFNFYPSQIKQLKLGKRLRVLGEQRQGYFGPEMVHPKYRVVGDGAPLAESLTPVYPTTAGLPQSTLKKLVDQALARCDLSDTLAEGLLKQLSLPSFEASVTRLHHPAPDHSPSHLEDKSSPAWRRLKFDELLAQQLSMRRAYRERRTHSAPKLSKCGELAAQLLAALPFELTNAQRRALDEINRDLGHDHPMQRLLQGDVGSGKTIVAALACARAIANSYQAVLMAPTEILAEQHFRKIDAMLTPFGVQTAWLTGGLKSRAKRNAVESVNSGDAQLIVGTHALFQRDIAFHRLGLVVIDEQHRFGVDQRLALRGKGTRGPFQPHQLMMSATPIPRTLAMSFFADLDVSVIDQLPPGRAPVFTKLVSDARREEVVTRIRAACRDGAQAYWVCPLIEESEALQLQTAVDTFAHLAATFPEFRVGLVHGRLTPAEKMLVMEAFKSGKIQLLVATTVIEVGVDVQNATLMVIENAERMGLSQLHQLRGRVGRGMQQSTCILLFQNPLSETARARLKIIYENTDGFEIARQDLALRGPGEFLGARQSGAPMLRFADLEQDVDLLEVARTWAERLLQQERATADRHLARWMHTKSDYLKV